MDAKRRFEARRKRHLRVRKHIRGTEERPRIAVFRSNKHIYAQLINDVDGRTLVAASSLDADARAGGAKKDVARKVGQLLGRRAVERGVQAAVLDRGGRLYHGRVAELADGARESGLKF
ncbi:MAG: 50S ribosomal protein L18 [Actinomycetota bacterium]